jgi:DNA invertase Pin-like site-specific DNA recombinase
MKAIAYIRTSSTLDSQSVSRDETQPLELQEWALKNGYEIIGSYTDMKSGKSIESRTGLLQAITHANITGAVILITELSRLTRSVKDCADLLDSNTKFIITRSGRHISKEMILIQSVFAQSEREATSKRMKAMLKGRFERNPELRKEWGNQRGIGLDRARQTRTCITKEHDDKVGFLAVDLRNNGISYQCIADRYNQLEIPTLRGGKWNKGSIYKMVKRINSQA